MRIQSYAKVLIAATVLGAAAYFWKDSVVPTVSAIVNFDYASRWEMGRDEVISSLVFSLIMAVVLVIWAATSVVSQTPWGMRLDAWVMKQLRRLFSRKTKSICLS